MQLETSIVPIERLELRFEPWLWPFAVTRRAEIDVHFDALRRKQPKLWNGRVLLLREHAIEGGTLRGACFETDYASMLAWRDFGFPDGTVKNAFPMGALRSREGAFLLGVMAPHTVNAGQIYFPSGTPEPQDATGHTVDFDGRLWREIGEETGLSHDNLTPDPRWTAVVAWPRIALIRVLHARHTADELCAKIRVHLAREDAPELSDVRIVRDNDDLDPMMPPFVCAFLAWLWAQAVI